MVLKRDDFESRKYPCEKCKKLKVRKRLGSRKAPRFCPDCLTIFRKAKLKEAREQKGKSKEPLGIMVMAPDGFPTRLKNEEERDYYEKRKKEYLEDFDWIGSADLSLLSRLLSLEISSRRYESRFSLKDSEARDRLNLIKEIRDTQEKLGIQRVQRKKRKEERSPLDIVQSLIKRFNDYRKKNPDRFVYICPNCGEKVYLKRENPKFKKENGATPIKEDDLKPNNLDELGLAWQQREGLND